MMIDDFSTPLGQNRTKNHRSGPPLALSRSIAVVISLCAVVLAGWAWRGDERFGGGMVGKESLAKESLAMSAVDLPGQLRPSTPARPAVITVGRASRETDADGFADDSAADVLRPGSTARITPATKTITIIDGTSGRRQEISIPVAADAASRPSRP